MIELIQQLKTSDECDAAHAAFEEQKKQMKQLVDSVSTAPKDLQRENAKHTKAVQKEAEDTKKAADEQKKKNAAKYLEAAKNQKFRAARVSSLFNSDWSQHKPITTFEEVRAAEHPLGELFILTKPTWAPEKNKMLDAWLEQFPSSREATALGRTQAPVETSHKLVEEHGHLASAPLPSESLLEGPHPALMSATGASFFYGGSKETGVVEYEPDVLGTVRVMYKGSFSKVILFAVSELDKVVPDICVNHG